MKKLLLLSILGIISILNPIYANSASGSDDFNSLKTSYEVSFFNEIEAGYNYDIEVIKSNECFVEVLFENEEDAKYAEIYTKNKTLFLKMKERPDSFFRKFKKQGEIKVKVYLTDLYSIDLSGASELKTNEKFVTENFYIRQSGATEIKGLEVDGTRIEVQCSGASDIELIANHIEAKYSFSGSSDGHIQQKTIDLSISLSGASDVNLLSDCESLIASISGSSDLKINGKGDIVEVKCSGASDFEGENFSCSKAVVYASGASDIELSISKELDIKLSGASSLYYYGNPRILSMSTSRGSSVKQR